MEEWRNETFIPQNERKKGLLLSDDFRMPSGVGHMSKEMVMKTIHHFNWVQVGGAIKHPEQGKIIDMSHEIKKLTDIDNYCRIYPTSGYGNQDMIRWLIHQEKPDFILHFTDPRFWIWLYQMEHEVRTKIPLFFYHIWDDLPFPRYNEDYYESCDWLGCISKQTYNIVKQVSQRRPVKPWQLSYIPHGVDETILRPLSVEEPGNVVEVKDGTQMKHMTEFDEMQDFKKNLLNNEDIEFIILFNSRNIRRKMPGDIILAFKYFLRMLPPEKREKMALVMHTHVVDNNGTDLMAIASTIAPECKIIFSPAKLEPRFINYLYNIADVTINISSYEGFGLSVVESLTAGTPVISNVTGGLQDQLGFKDKKGKYLDPDKHYGPEWGSNHDGKYKKHGVWAKPVFPTNRAMVGSPPTPWIFDDRVDFEDAAIAIKYWYDIPKEKRDEYGLEGRKYVLDPEQGMTATLMGLNFVKFMDNALESFTPRPKYELVNTSDRKEVHYSTGISLTKLNKMLWKEADNE